MIRIANVQGFWGDDTDAPARLVRQTPVDVLTLDYLAEVSMSILARQRQKDAAHGYARDFPQVVRSLHAWLADGGTIVTNAGGLNPFACATAVVEGLRAAGLAGLKVATIEGDDVLPHLRANPSAFTNLETGEPLAPIAANLVTANAYIGADLATGALRQGARVVIAGRMADPSMAVAPAAARFGWGVEQFSQLAGATVAGHLIECGTQATGGIFTDWLNLPNHNIGFPVVELSADSSCVLTKPPGTGGVVNAMTVKEQLLYELGDPGRYLSPDCAVSFLTLNVDDLGNDRVKVSGATGTPPTEHYKVSATYRAGYRAASMLTIIGKDAVLKARRCGEIVRQRLADAGKLPERLNVEVLGSGDAACGVLGRRDDLTEVVLRISASDPEPQPVEFFARQLVPLVTAGPQGTTGYFDAKAEVREVYGYWPTLIPRSQVALNMKMFQT